MTVPGAWSKVPTLTVAKVPTLTVANVTTLGCMVPQLGSSASSGRAWRLWAARHS